jgi:predicted AAA+ superfamily ATPase
VDIQTKHLKTLGKVQGKFTRQQHKVSIQIQHLNQEQDEHLFKLIAEFLHSASENENS